MCHKGQVGECKILFPYVAFISHFTVFAMFINFLINIYGIMIISINLDYRKYGIG
jgi:hypothetical protein